MRPKNNKAEYFPHSANASNGKSLFILQNTFGNDGYAFWFKSLELLSASDHHFLDLSSHNDWLYYVSYCRVEEEKLAGIISQASKMGMIDKKLWEKSKVVYCPNLVRNLEPLYKRRKSNPMSLESLYIQFGLIDKSVKETDHELVKFAKSLKFVSKMKTPLTNEQAEKLLELAPIGVVKETISSLENYKKGAKTCEKLYTNTYLTLRKWLKPKAEATKSKQVQL